MIIRKIDKIDTKPKSFILDNLKKRHELIEAG